MKKLLILGLVVLGVLLGGRAWGQTTLPVSRTTWSGAEPTGWSLSGTSTYTTECSGVTGSSCKLDNSLDWIQVYFNSEPSQLSCIIKGESASGSYIFRVQESVNGTTWTNLETFSSSNLLPSTCTPKVYTLSSTSRYVRWYYETKSAGNVRLDEVSISQPACTPPSQATAFSPSNIQSTQMDVSWTAGGGSNTLVVARSGSAVNADPVFGTGYTANAAFSSGAQIGTGNYVVYNGTGTSVTVTGLTANTTYHYAIYSYSGASGSECYNATELTGSATTPILNVSTATLTGFTYINGAGPSTSQSFNLSGSNLTGAPGNITVTGSTDYEVSSDNGTFGGSATVAYSAATLSSMPVYVRLKAGLATGTYNSQTISISGGGDTESVTCSGSVTDAANVVHTGTSPAAADVYQGTQDNILYKVQLDVTNTTTTLSQVVATTSGTWDSDDISNVKLRYSTDATLSGGDATLATISAGLTGGALDLTFNGFSQVVPVGTVYLFITADVSATATLGNTLTATVDADGDLTYTASTTFSGSTFAAGNAITVIGQPEIQLEWPVGTNLACGGTVAIGNVALGTSSSQTIRVRNLGNADLNITNLPLSFTGTVADYAFTTALTSPIAAGAFADMVILFTPSASGARNAALSISDNDLSEGTCAINFTATGTVPDIQLQQPAGTNKACGYTHAFGTKNINTTSSVTITVANLGTHAPLTLGTLALSGTNAGEFSVSTPTSTTIAAAGTATFDISFTPTSDGAKTATLTIPSNDPDEASCSIMLTGTGLEARHFRTIANTAWNVNTTWESSADNSNWSASTRTPTDADLSISILNAVTVPANVTVDQLTIGSAGQVTVNSTFTLTIANGTSTDLLIDGTLTNNGSVLLQGTTSTIVNGTFSNNGTVTMSTVSTNLTVNGTFDQLTSGTLTNASAGPITFAAGSTYKHSRSGGVIPTATWNVTSLCNVTGVTGTAPTGLGQTFGQFTWNCPGQSGNLDVALSGFGTTGMFTITSTNALYINMNPSSSALTASIYGINISGGSKLSLNNTSSTTGYTTLNIGNGGLTVAGTNTTVEFAGGSTNVTGFYRTTINLTGNISLGTGSIVRANSSSDFGQIFYTGNTEQNFTSSITTTRIDHNIAVGAMLKLLSNFNLRSASSTDYDQLEVLGTLNTGAFAVAASSGTFSLVYVNGGATIQTANSTGLNTALGASLRTIEAGANYVFDAATITAFPTTAQVATFGNPANVTVNANITINRALTIDGILTLAAGNLTLGANTLTISATGSITGANSTNYIITNGAGKLKRNSVTASTAFPIGSASVYTPVTLANAGTSDDFSVSFTETTAACVPAATSVTGTWDISEGVAGGSDCTISIDYGSSATGASFDGADAKIGHCSGTTMDYNSGSVSGSLVAGSGFTSFSPFGITSISALPVELLSFNATKHSNHTLLSFATASERNNARFEIERSADGRVFQVIGAVKGAGDAQTQNNYTFTDEHPMRGINYYRLRQVDVDGASTLSQVVSVTFGKTGNVVLYPTPASETMNVRFDEAFTTDANWQIVDLTGRILNEGIFAAEQTEFRIPVASLTQGAYILRVTANNEVVTQQFRKQ